MTRLPRRRFLTVAACAALAGSGQVAPLPQRLTWRGTALGADVAITLDGPPDITRPALARARLEIAAFDARFSLFRDQSDLVRLNRQRHLPDLDRHWHDLLLVSTRLHRATGGLFDPTIQPLWRAHARGAGVDAARALVGWERVQVPGNGRRGVALDSGQALSFNGVAQGAATDAVRDTLQAAGMTRVLVDIGETATIGGPWQIGAADPRHGLFARVELNGTALAVSSPDALRLAGHTHHILDPSGTRRPRWSSVAVVADSAAVADGLSTAACLMSGSEIREAAAALAGVRAIHMVDHDGTRHTLAG